MTIDRAQSLYARRAKLYQLFFSKLLKWETVLADFFQANPYLHPGSKVLDAGCGTGSITRVLYEHAGLEGVQPVTFHAFDLTPAMLDLFRQWIEEAGAQDIQLRRADVLNTQNDLPPDWNDYDLIVSSALLEYIPKEQIDRALGNLKRLLAEEGRLLVLVTKRTRIAQWTGERWWGTNLFEPDEIEMVLRQAGFPTVQFKKLPARWDRYMLAVEAKSNAKAQGKSLTQRH